MEHAKKMILIDPRILNSLQNNGPPVEDATSNSLRDMDERMRSILQSDDLDADRKHQMYQDTLRKYRTRVDQYKDKPLGSVIVKESQSTNATPDQQPEKDSWGMIEQEIIESAPKTLKNKAEKLLQRIQNHPDLKWNDRGEIIWKDRLVQNSNLYDLVHDVLRKRKRPKPTGWEIFAEALGNANVPRELMGNPDRWITQKATTPQATPQSRRTPRNVALASIEQMQKERVDRVKETPLTWKRKSHKKKRKNQSLKKRFEMMDWQTI